MTKTNMIAGALGRRAALTRAGFGAAAIGAMAAGVGIHRAEAAETSGQPSDADILNFALNLEYLEAEYYLTCVTGQGLPASDLTGQGTEGAATGAKRVTFTTPWIKQLAEEIAQDEMNHVTFLRSQLGDSAVAQPAIDLANSFLALGQTAGLGFPFDPYADENMFLLGAFVFEDVGVTAYNGAAPLLMSKTNLGYAASILAVEAYHAGGIRTLLVEKELAPPADKIAATRAAVSGTGPGTGQPADDQGPRLNGKVNLTPADTNSLAFARTTSQVLSVVYLGGTTSGGFFPERGERDDQQRRLISDKCRSGGIATRGPAFGMVTVHRIPSAAFGIWPLHRSTSSWPTCRPELGRCLACSCWSTTGAAA